MNQSWNRVNFSSGGIDSIVFIILSNPIFFPIFRMGYACLFTLHILYFIL
jgi:hypothetical protein